MEKQHSHSKSGPAERDVSCDIFIKETSDRVMIFAGGVCIADTVRSKVLTESKRPPVHYVPKADVKMAYLDSSTHGSVCSYKGNCSYFDIVVGGVRMSNVVWSYVNPKTTAASIAGYLAFMESKGAGDGVTIEINASPAVS
jgi:uncharacterized protein (DUF427 family)